MDWQQLVVPPAAAFLIAVILTPQVANLALKFGFVDRPTRKHPAILHKRIVPRAGGVIFAAATVIPMLLFLPVEKRLIGLTIGVILAGIVGVLDDKFDLNPYLRLATNFIIAAAAVGTGIGIAFVTNPFDGIIRLDQIVWHFNFFGPHSLIILADIFALFWIVWIMNMLNWSSGVDGQISGIILITAIILAILSLRFVPSDPSQITVTKLALITSAAAAGFLIYNWHPAKIFPGYGVTVLGFLIASLAILSGAKVATALLVMAVPAADGLTTIARRIAKKQSPVWPDRGHLHHLFLKLGWSQKQIAVFYWTISLALGIAALNLKSAGKLFAILIVGVVVVGAVLWLNLILKPKQ